MSRSPVKAFLIVATGIGFPLIVLAQEPGPSKPAAKAGQGGPASRQSPGQGYGPARRQGRGPEAIDGSD